ncbi:anti-phage ZorAB system protein ZorA [Salinisphaera sp. LB1]|uniref:anti-phage ZorAB system protein ZorA n=1 Tax=Salinisphaera sp. LB1 TaxID=2183911 RepID=UPI000D70621D|nr:anti-phage ZorAB system protein ZorA [Salinisphaera sp. LB1]AWN14247.1 putative membrane protein [Salinisphaera sp. LB1]
MDILSAWLSVAGVLTSSYMTASVVVAILLITLGIGLWFKLQLRPVMRDLRQASRLVEGVPEDEAAFAAEFHSIKEKLSDNRTLGHAWREFGEVLIYDAWSGDSGIRNAQSPGDYFYLGSVTSNRINLRFFNTFPNILTGLGILGTFVGLAAGISLASHGLGSDDPVKMQAALQQLLSGASLAFFTSIAGMVCSIVLNLYEKGRIHRLDGAVQRFVDALDARLKRVTVESLANDQLEESKEQTQALKVFSNDLAFQIADALSEKFSANLGPTLEKLVDAVEGMRDQRKDDTTEMLERMLKEFQTSLSGAAGQELSSLGHTLELLNEKLTSQISTIGSQQATLQSQHEQSLDNLRSTLATSRESFNTEVGRALKTLSDTLGTSVEEVARELRSAGEDAGTRLTEMTTRLSETVEQINTTIQSSAEAAEQHRQISEHNRETLDSMRAAGEHFGQLAEPVARSASAIEESASAIKDTATSFISVHDGIHESVSRIEAIQTQLGEAWSRYEQRFESVDESLASVFEELHDGLSQYTSSLNGYVKDLDKHTSSITSDLAGAVGELNEMLEGLEETLSSERVA